MKTSAKAKTNRLVNKIHSGDVLKHLAKLKYGDVRFNVIIADPPYNIGKDFGNNKDQMPLDEYVYWSRRWIDDCLGLLASNGILYVYGFPEILAHISVGIPRDRQRWLAWHYTNKTVPSLRFWQRSHETILCLWNGKRPRLSVDEIREKYTPNYLKCVGKVRKETLCRYNRKGKKTIYNGHANGALPRDVIKVPALAGGAGKKERWFVCRSCGNRLFHPRHRSEHQDCDVLLHPTQKPTELTRILLRSVVGNGHGAMLAPFAGSGSECVVAQEMGIDYCGIEINKEYVLFARKWLKKIKGGGSELLIMFRLTPRMIQRLKQELGKYHGQFSGGRCQGWELEELIAASILSDYKEPCMVRWDETGHNKDHDIVVEKESVTHQLQIKAGTFNKSGHLTLSGYRLGSCQGDHNKITDCLNSKKADILSVPYEQHDCDQGRIHDYSICYIDADKLSGLEPNKWQVTSERAGSIEQTNKYGVVFSVRPSMSWQVWWTVPKEAYYRENTITIT